MKPINAAAAIPLLLCAAMFVIGDDRNFSGAWKLHEQSSDARLLPLAPEKLLKIDQQGMRIDCKAGENREPAANSCSLHDGWQGSKERLYSRIRG